MSKSDEMLKAEDAKLLRSSHEAPASWREDEEGLQALIEEVERNLWEALGILGDDESVRGEASQGESDERGRVGRADPDTDGGGDGR